MGSVHRPGRLVGYTLRRNLKLVSLNRRRRHLALLPFGVFIVGGFVGHGRGAGFGHARAFPHDGELSNRQIRCSVEIFDEEMEFLKSFARLVRRLCKEQYNRESAAVRS
jgi:hypothetical protein